MVYRFDTEIKPIISMRLKIEINTREHFNVLGLKDIPYKVENSWFSGECTLIGYELEELLGTKMRALYQRRKGRDLFDLYWALIHREVDTEKLTQCYKTYMAHSVEKPPTQKQFLSNMEEKMTDIEFTNDIQIVLRPGVEFDIEKAWETIKRVLITKI